VVETHCPTFPGSTSPARKILPQATTGRHSDGKSKSLGSSREDRFANLLVHGYLCSRPELGKEGRMAIRSNAFGRITLTGPDAKKFRNQASYGKPKAAAAKNVKKGLLMLKQATSSRNRLVFKIHT
jgi:hypothetical protein